MLVTIIGLLLLIVATVCVLLQRAYNLLPAIELKRQAAQNNATAVMLFRAVSYGVSLRALLWIGILLGSALGAVMLAANTALWLSLLLIALSLWLNFSWLPRQQVGRITLAVARLLTPLVVWKLHYLDAPLRLLARLLQRIGTRVPQHSGLYELEDLLDMLQLQSSQTDSRITLEEITLIRGVVDFGSQRVQDVMRPRAQVKSVTLGDAIGPVLLDEMHASGQTVFPVKKSTRSKEIVAALHLHDVGIHSTGTVQDYATQGVTYINHDDTLADALHAFFQTKQQLFVVIDSEQAYLGVITLEDILHSLVGRPAADEQLGSHDEPAAVAARHEDETVVE